MLLFARYFPYMFQADVVQVGISPIYENHASRSSHLAE
jgi:hypothetical protein